MRALEKERHRRYQTAHELAADVRRYLSDEPVLAGPPSALHRLRKYVHRNRGPVAAASAIFLALAIGLVVSLLLYAGQQRTTRDLATA